MCRVFVTPPSRCLGLTLIPYLLLLLLLLLCFLAQGGASMNHGDDIMDSSSEFVPLTGFVRPFLLRIPSPLSKVLSPMLSSLDRLSYSIARRPSVRLFAAMYVITMHVIMFYLFLELSSTQSEIQLLYNYFHHQNMAAAAANGPAGGPVTTVTTASAGAGGKAVPHSTTSPGASGTGK